MPNGKISKSLYEIIIDGENDNYPQFTNPQNNPIIHIAESAEVGDIVSLEDCCRAVDKDSGDNAKIIYKLSQNDYFALLNPSGAPLALKLIKKLDAETNDIHRLTLTAVDSPLDPSEAKSQSLSIEILVEDENDNAPVFELERYHAEISENARLNQVVIRVVANDKDDTSRIRYSIIYNDRLGSILPFSIDSITGDIKVNGPLDYETVKL